MGNLIKAIILGIVEGITEWLPVSSTGHLILVENLIHMDASANFKTMFEVVIQLGAILAVCVLYFRKLNPFSRYKNDMQKRKTWILWAKVFVATLPAAILGFLFDDAIDRVMGKPVIISVVLIVFGVLFIVVENKTAGREPVVRRLGDIDYRLALIIGCGLLCTVSPVASDKIAGAIAFRGVGIAGLIVCAFFAQRLYRDMKNGK